MFEDIEERYNNPTEEMKRRGVKPGSAVTKCLKYAKSNGMYPS